MFEGQLGCDVCRRPLFGSCVNGDPIYLILNKELSQGPCKPLMLTRKEIRICVDCYPKVESKIKNLFADLLGNK